MAVLEIPYRTGRLIVLGDLHHDSYMRDGTDPFTAHELDQSLFWDVDALIVAGDLANMPLMNWRPTLMFLKRFVPASRIYVLPGNHDFYGHLLDEEDDLRLIAEIAGANFVQKKELRLGATRILVCTLWTDFVRIPRKMGTYSTRSWALIPRHRGQPFHAKVGSWFDRRFHGVRLVLTGQGLCCGRRLFACFLR